MTYLGGLSFSPLYPSGRSKDLPETPRWAARAAGDPAPEWTDVLLDFRIVRTDLPAALPETRAAQWPPAEDGWILEGWTWEPPPGSHGTHVDERGHEVPSPVDGVSVARFTDPDGFRFAIAVSNDRPGERPKFASGRLQILLPAMRLVFSPKNFYGGPNRRRGGHPAPTAVFGWPNPGDPADPTRTYSLEALRDAVRDPAGWFGSADWADLALDGPFRPITAARALLGWASGGATSFDEVEQWTRAGLDACELAGWRALTRPAPSDADADTGAGDGDAEPEPRVFGDPEIGEWFAAFGGGSKRRGHAARWHATGLSPALAARWQDTFGGAVGQHTGALVEGFEEAGWSPEDVSALLACMARTERDEDGRRAWPLWADPPPAVALEWVFVSPSRAAAYVAAGYSAGEARALEEAGTPAEDASLALMAAMLPEPVDLGGFF